MIQHLAPAHPDRLDDYRAEEIAVRRALEALRWARHDAPVSDKTRARRRALTLLQEWGNRV